MQSYNIPVLCVVIIFKLIAKICWCLKWGCTLNKNVEKTNIKCSDEDSSWRELIFVCQSKLKRECSNN